MMIDLRYPLAVVAFYVPGLMMWVGLRMGGADRDLARDIAVLAGFVIGLIRTLEVLREDPIRWRIGK